MRQRRYYGIGFGKMNGLFNRSTLHELVDATDPDVFLYRGIEFGEVLKDNSEVRMIFVWVVATNVNVVDSEGPLIEINCPGKDFGERRFS